MRLAGSLAAKPSLIGPAVAGRLFKSDIVAQASCLRHDVVI
jgi:hypothetical protein